MKPPRTGHPRPRSVAPRAPYFDVDVPTRLLLRARYAEASPMMRLVRHRASFSFFARRSARLRALDAPAIIVANEDRLARRALATYDDAARRLRLPDYRAWLARRTA